MLKRKFILIGVIAFITIFIFIWGYNYLNGKNIFSKDKWYYALYDQTEGLNVGSPVTLKGIRIGQIKKIEFTDKYATKLLVVINIEKNFKIPLGSVAEIYNADIIGTKELRIISSSSRKFHNPGDTLIGRIEKGLMDNLEPLKAKTEELMTSIDSVVDVLNSLIIANKQAINSSIKNIQTTISNFEILSANLKKMTAEPDGKLNIIISDLQSITTTLKNNEENLDNALTNFSSISDSLAASNIKQTVETTNKVLNDLKQITTKINNGEGTIGQLIENDSLYNNIENLSRNLDSLVIDIEENPRKYLRFSVIDLSKNK